jgi:hypothetical protein
LPPSATPALVPTPTVTPTPTLVPLFTRIVDNVVGNITSIIIAIVGSGGLVTLLAKYFKYLLDKRKEKLKERDKKKIIIPP